jgi:hypothetical protein
MGVLAVHGRNSSGGFLVDELVIPSRIIIYPVEGQCWQSADENPSDGNKSGFLTMKEKFKLENVIKMINKPYLAILRTSYLSTEIKKMIPKSRETIPLNKLKVLHKQFDFFSVQRETMQNGK